MKILFLSNKDLASNYALNMLLPVLSKNNEIHLWLSAKVGKNTKPPRQLKTLKFFEQSLFIDLLSPLISSSKNPNSFKAFTDMSSFLSSELREENRINSPEAVAAIKALSPDLVVSIRYGGILKEGVINIPPKGVINLHSGILPKYKGVMATFWALKNRDSEIGTTLHTIENGSIDTGNIIKISKMAATSDKSYLWHVLKLYEQGCADILWAVESMTKGEKLASYVQAQSPDYFTFPTEQACEAFERMGFNMVDEQDYMSFIQKHY